MTTVAVGDQVRVNRGVAAKYRVYTYTVREVAGHEVVVDNGLPDASVRGGNGLTVSAVLPASAVTAWGDTPRREPETMRYVRDRETLRAALAEVLGWMTEAGRGPGAVKMDRAKELRRLVEEKP